MASVTLTMRLALTPRRPSTRYAELELGYKSTVVVRALPSLGTDVLRTNGPSSLQCL